MDILTETVSCPNCSCDVVLIQTDSCYVPQGKCEHCGETVLMLWSDVSGKKLITF